jgi:hypothetical protein
VTPDVNAKIERSFECLLRQLENLRAQGVELFLVRMPIHSLADQWPLETSIRGKLYSAFPRNKYECIEVADA